MKTRRTLRLVCLAAFLTASAVVAQTKLPEIPAEAKKRLDHHIGEWDVRTEFLGRDGQVVRTTTALDTARYIIPGRVVELTTELPEQGSTSKAWMFYSVAEAKYYLTSVDAKGDLWVLSGGLDEYIITSEPRPHPRGGTIMIRFTHTNIKPDSFEAVMEMSRDEGKRWWKRSRQVLTRRK
ncbi:MAG: DUF1579 domain-containing protein [bacterium]|nr:DUF1579 domain-containing protein [bacterium]